MKSDKLKHAKSIYSNELYSLWTYRHWIPDSGKVLIIKRLKSLRREIEILNNNILRNEQ
mgnify:FL=1|jgi:hypothetical protein